MIDSVALPVIGQIGVCGWELDTVAPLHGCYGADSGSK